MQVWYLDTDFDVEIWSMSVRCQYYYYYYIYFYIRAMFGITRLDALDSSTVFFCLRVKSFCHKRLCDLCRMHRVWCHI